MGWDSLALRMQQDTLTDFRRYHVPFGKEELDVV